MRPPVTEERRKLLEEVARTRRMERSERIAKLGRTRPCWRCSRETVNDRAALWDARLLAWLCGYCAPHDDFTALADGT